MTNSPCNKMTIFNSHTKQTANSGVHCYSLCTNELFLAPKFDEQPESWHKWGHLDHPFLRFESCPPFLPSLGLPPENTLEQSLINPKFFLTMDLVYQSFFFGTLDHACTHQRK